MSKTVELTTPFGTIRVELDDVKAPASTENSWPTCAPATMTAPCSTG